MSICQEELKLFGTLQPAYVVETDLEFGCERAVASAMERAILHGGVVKVVYVPPRRGPRGWWCWFFGDRTTDLERQCELEQLCRDVIRGRVPCTWSRDSQSDSHCAILRQGCPEIQPIDSPAILALYCRANFEGGALAESPESTIIKQ